MYTKSFDIRWADLDPNRHVANSTFAALLNETRFSLLHDHGITQKEFAQYNFGPVIFSEEFHYIKEILPKERIVITLELLANSPDYSYMKFAHHIFNQKKQLCLYSETFFGWIDLSERKLIAPPPPLLEVVSKLEKADNYAPLPSQLNLKNSKINYHKVLPVNI